MWELKDWKGWKSQGSCKQAFFCGHLVVPVLQHLICSRRTVRMPLFEPIKRRLVDHTRLEEGGEPDLVSDRENNQPIFS